MLPSHADTAHPTVNQLKRLFVLVHKAGWKMEQFREFLLKKYEITSTKELTLTHYDYLCNFLLPCHSPDMAMKTLEVEDLFNQGEPLEKEYFVKMNEQDVRTWNKSKEKNV